MDSENKSTAEDMVRLQMVLEHCEVGTFYKDIQLRTITADDRFFQIIGMENKQAIEQSDFFEQILHPDDSKMVLAEFEKCLKYNTPFSQRFRILKPDGELLHVRMQCRTVWEPERSLYQAIGMLWDISKEVHATQELEERRMQLIESSKMAALGEMAAGVAHEINNPLAVILGKVEILDRELAKDQPNPKTVSAAIESVRRMCERGAKIIQGLREYSRDGSADEFESFSLQEMVNSVLDLTQEKIRSLGIELTSNFPKEEIHLHCRKVQVEQILINLLSNAIDAVKEESLKRVELRADRLPTGGIEISVIDSGPGIPPEIADKIMHPFFTTKKVGEGTGLGLSIAFGIMKAHGGDLFLDRKSKKTRFVVYFPKIEESEQAA